MTGVVWRGGSWTGVLGLVATWSLSALAPACTGNAKSSEGSPSVGRAAETVGGGVVLTTELSLDHPVRVERLAGCPHVAFGTSTFLVTHTDTYYGSQTDALQGLVATRFNRAGDALEPGGKHIATFTGTACAPVVFTGTNFVTVWATDHQLYCARIGEDGEVLEPEGVATGQTADYVGELAFDGTNLLALVNGPAVALVDTSCHGIGSTTALAVTPSATIVDWTLAFDGTKYWVAYGEKLEDAPDRFLLQAVSTAGVPVGTPALVAETPWLRDDVHDPPPPPLPGGFRAGGRIAGGNGRAAVAYYLAPDHADTAKDELWFAGVDANGALVDPVSAAAEITPDQYALPMLGFAGDGFLLVGSLGGEVSKHRDDGTVVTEQLADFEYATGAEIANDGQHVLLLRSGQPDPSPPVSTDTSTTRLRLLDGQLAPFTDDTPLVEVATSHQSILAAQGATSTLIAWKENWSLYGARVAPDGTVLDEPRFTIRADPYYERAIDTPALTSNGTDFLFGWATKSEELGLKKSVEVQLVHADGSLGGSPLQVFESIDGQNFLPAITTPALATNGSDFFATWVYYEPLYQVGGAVGQIRVQGARITAAGAVLDNPPLLLRSYPYPNPDYGTHVDVVAAYDGSAYVVASSVIVPYGDPVPVEVLRVTAAGEQSAPTELDWDGVVTTMAWGHGQGLLVRARDTDLIANRIDDTLGVLDANGFTITDQHYFSTFDARTSVAWDGTDYWVSWKDSRQGAYDDLYVARVSTGGQVLDPSGFPLSLTPSEPQMSVAPFYGVAGAQLLSGPGRIFAAYTRYDPALTLQAHLPYGRWLSSAPNDGGAAGTGASSGTGVAGDTSAIGGDDGGASAGGTSSGSGHHGGSTNSSIGGTATESRGGSTASSSGGNDDGGGDSSGDTSHGGASATIGGSSPEGGKSAAGASAGHSTAKGGAGGKPEEPGSGCGCRVSAGNQDDAKNLLAALMVALGLRRRFSVRIGGRAPR